MKSEKETWSFRRVLWIIFMALASVVILHNLYLMSRDMLYGDFSAAHIFPQPHYGFLRVPDTTVSRKYEAVNRLGADFTQIYFPAQKFESIARNYKNGVFDPWDRPSRMAPFLHLLCSRTICKLSYGWASLLHMLIQIVVFYFFFITAFRALGVASDLLHGLLLVGILLFVSSAGLSWFERGQYSLYVAISHLLLIGGLMKNRLVPVAWAGLFAFIKWTSLPFALVVFAVYMLKARTRAEWVRNAQLLGVFLLPFLVLTLVVPHQTFDFVSGLYRQELFAQPKGISLMFLLPAAWVKILPLALIVIGYLHLRRHHGDFDRLLPYFMGAGVLLLIYPTVAHEYNVPALFCFIPYAFYWRKLHAGTKDGPLHQYLAFSFLFFLVLASYALYLNPSGNPLITISAYILFSAALLLIPLLGPQDNSSRPPANAMSGSPAN